MRLIRLILILPCLLVLFAAAPAGAADCDTQEGCIEQARSARAFIDSAGVNTHLGYSDTVYWWDWPMVRDRLKELGVSHIRDGTFPAAYPHVIGPTVAARYNELNAAGIKGNLMVGVEHAHNDITLAQRLDWIKANLADFTASVEGSSESWDDANAIRDLQCDIYARVKSDPVLSSKPVIGPSGGPPFSETAWYDRVGDLSGCLDKGNLHPYPGADPPNLHQHRDLSAAMEWGARTYGASPNWATETGYWNTLTDANGVSETAAGIYVPRTLTENFRRGIERTELYELVDLHTGSGEAIDHYGLLRTDGTRKPAYVATRNLLSLLQDGVAASGRLGFGIVCTSNCRAPIRHVLLRHSSGAYYLALWSESRVWDEASKTDTPTPPQTLDLYLHRAPQRVEVYAPARGTSPVATDTSGATLVRTRATDDVRLVKITPAAGAAGDQEP
ncbi:MAG: hypothetical protein M3296_00155 [Actinomycetota bacterium]|nr:hypothetical protein [Actinomycetota bacterium]